MLMNKRNMYKIYIVCFSILIACSNSKIFDEKAIAFQKAKLLDSLKQDSIKDIQNRFIYGKVTDENHKIIIGAIIRIMGTTLGAKTDSNGQYKILIKHKGVYEIRTTFIGFKQDIPDKKINIDKFPFEYNVTLYQIEEYLEE